MSQLAEAGGRMAESQQVGSWKEGRARERNERTDEWDYNRGKGSGRWQKRKRMEKGCRRAAGRKATIVDLLRRRGSGGEAVTPGTPT